MGPAIKRFRLSLGLSQADFGRLVERSHQSVRNYENGLGEIPDEVVNRITELAAEKGQPFSLQQPPEILAGSAPHGNTQKWHDLLEQILKSGDPEGIQAVQSNLRAFGKYINQKTPRRGSPEDAKQRQPEN